MVCRSARYWVGHGTPHLLIVVVGEQLHDGADLLAVDVDVAGSVAASWFYRVSLHVTRF